LYIKYAMNGYSTSLEQFSLYKVKQRVASNKIHITITLIHKS